MARRMCLLLLWRLDWLSGMDGEFARGGMDEEKRRGVDSNDARIEVNVKR